MRLGTPTNVPGVYRDGAAWIIRATARTQTGVKTEKRKRLEKASQGEAMVALEQLRVELRDEIASGPKVKLGDQTLSVYAHRWLESLLVKRAGKIKKASIETRIHYLERFVLPFAGQKTPSELQPSDMEDWKMWLARQRQPERIGKTRNARGGEGYAHETLLSAWATMRALLGFVTIKAGVRNPIAGLRFDVEGRERTPKAALTQAELTRLIDAAAQESPDIRVMLIVGFVSGMRFCELSALEWRDIDLGEGVVRIQRSQVLGEVGPPKTESSRRQVYLPPEVVSELQTHRAWQIAEQVAGLEKGLVFPSTRGGYRAPSVLKKPLKRCCEQAGIDKHLTSHCLRVTTNNLVRQTAGDAAARAMVGHATPAMTVLYSDVDKAERLAVGRKAFGRWLDSDAGVPGVTGNTRTAVVTPAVPTSEKK